MKNDLENILGNWPRTFIKDSDLAMLFVGTDDARYSLVKQALKLGALVRLRKGLYLIGSKTKNSLPDEFELALLIYGQSFVSLESALSHYGWIPESVYTTTCVSTKQAREFETPFGLFSYKYVPAENFYVCVKRITKNNESILVATPWRAIADLIYVRRKSWERILDLEEDLRIERETFLESDLQQLEQLSENYSNRRVREYLEKYLKEIRQIL